jgi:hypothetical protein
VCDGPSGASCSKYDGLLLSLVDSTVCDRQCGHCGTLADWGTTKCGDRTL